MSTLTTPHEPALTLLFAEIEGAAAESGEVFRRAGRARLRVDLLVPSTNDDYPTIPVPELKAHAKGMPCLAYLLGASQEVPVLSSHAAVMVRVPTPERFAIHKLIVSQLRTKTVVGQ